MKQFTVIDSERRENNDDLVILSRVFASYSLLRAFLGEQRQTLPREVVGHGQHSDPAEVRQSLSDDIPLAISSFA
jgi:hypothetical protein